MKRLLRIAGLTLLFLLLLAALWQFARPMDLLNRVSLYNHIFPGRERLPFGESPQTAYNFSIGSLDAAFASHKIHGTGKKDPQTLRVVTVGDSSSWGTLLRPEETLCGQLDGKILSDGRTVACYNLAYPTLSLAKDYLLLNRAMDYDPDLILWPLTLESFPKDKQADNALVQANSDEYDRLFPDDPVEEDELTPAEIFGDRRREAADWLRLQLYGVMWAGTGIDQDYPEDYLPPQVDLEPDNSYHGYEGALPEDALAWDILEKGMDRAGDTPVLLINEPMLISSGENSEIRYNYYYPREAYDSWHEALLSRAEAAGWNLLDLWDVLENEAFTNSAIHYSAESAALLAERVAGQIEVIAGNR
ncbi:MAG: hypothetical protein IJI07_09575 [Flexilinea sp.]|nr:hypothetical protein [Flexilinea sp.]